MKATTRPRDRIEVAANSYVGRKTQQNQQSVRKLGSQVPHEGVQEADGDNRSSANSEDDEIARTQKSLLASLGKWAAAWFPRLWRPAPSLQFPRADGSPTLHDDVSFREPFSPAMSIISSYEPTHLAETTQGLSIFERVYWAISLVFHGIDRFAEFIFPLAVAVLFLSFFVHIVILLYLEVSSYYHSLNESSAVCHFCLTSPFLSVCRSTNALPTMDSPAVDTFGDMQIMTERGISTIDEADQAASTSLAISNASTRISTFREALAQTDLRSRDILSQEIAKLFDKSEANQGFLDEVQQCSS